MYHMTVYDENGNKLYDEPISAQTDEEAKKIGYAWLAKHGHETKPHRIFHTTGRLVSFKPHQFDLKRGKATL
ncbi:YhzD family protein [Lihuaxuella thermophila]|uniref:YhzD-like protein n=1 Tax=Lihuaxuella thermophila TaxID=1173111 RepID=A0A1H8H583_9BACL|nr:YhzD family protein [Lihuaxuella thermophila]SEN51413.1 YhzD-like protein [Lihuaxuella thermophila]